MSVDSSKQIVVFNYSLLAQTSPQIAARVVYQDSLNQLFLVRPYAHCIEQKLSYYIPKNRASINLKKMMTTNTTVIKKCTAYLIHGLASSQFVIK